GGSGGGVKDRLVVDGVVPGNGGRRCPAPPPRLSGVSNRWWWFLVVKWQVAWMVSGVVRAMKRAWSPCFCDRRDWQQGGSCSPRCPWWSAK
ncbi:hypothetical protein Dimus_036420, partial [Dionaea muscipula]